MRNARKNGVLFGLVALGSATPIITQRSNTSAIVWSTCPGSIPAGQTYASSGIECGHLEVPMNHSNPDGTTITIGLARLTANGTNTLGALFLNPGGPGGSAISLLKRQAKDGVEVSREVREQYDLIAVDPRGVGQSTPVTCNATIGSQRVNPYPTNKAGYDKLVAYNKALGESCADLTGELINFVDTISAARDLDLVREALNQTKLNWLGFSYGTQLGSQYAVLFPDRIGRMVLDGCVDHSQGEVSSFIAETTTYERTLDEFFKWCNTATSCAFHGEDLPKIFDALIDQANQDPIPAPGCTGKEGNCRTDATGYEILGNVQGLLVYQNGTVALPTYNWATLSKYLLAAVNGNATSLSGAIGTATGYAGIAIGCQDWLHSSASYVDVGTKVLLGRAISPHTRGVSQSLNYQTLCIGWPTPVSNPQQYLDPEEKLMGKQTVLLVNSFYDPETSIQWAVGLQEQMTNAVAIFRDGAGHTSYGINMDGGIQAAVDDYLLNGTVPAGETIYAN